MVSPEEISGWSLDELQAQIRALLPQGWDLVDHRDPSGYWTYKIQHPDADSKPVVELEREGADKRLVLIDLFGWLWFRNMPQPPKDSPWVRKNDPTIASVTRRTQGSHVPDPEDLDPSEIAKVHKSRK